MHANFVSIFTLGAICRYLIACAFNKIILAVLLLQNV